MFCGMGVLPPCMPYMDILQSARNKDEVIQKKGHIIGAYIKKCALESVVPLSFNSLER